MSEAEREILRLVAEGKITPEEGERLLDTLRPSPAKDREGRPDEASAEEAREDETEGMHPCAGRFSDAVAQLLDEIGEAIRRTVEDAVSATHRAFEEHRPATRAVPIQDGRFTLPPRARLKIQQAVRVSFGGGSKGGNVILRTVSTDQLRVVRGEAVEAHHDELDYVLTWAKGNLELEIPNHLGGLEVRCMGGDLEIIQFPGAMTAETMGGELRVQSPRDAFRFRTLGGKVRVADLGLRDGSASISSTGGDVQIEVASTASVTIRASSLGGILDLPEESEREVQGRARRRGICVIGDGTAELRVDTLGGNIRVRRTH